MIIVSADRNASIKNILGLSSSNDFNQCEIDIT
jgi:hypothetical protein